MKTAVESAMPSKGKNRLDEEVQNFIVRIPKTMHEALTKDAFGSFRSINSHILWLISERLSGQK